MLQVSPEGAQGAEEPGEWLGTESAAGQQASREQGGRDLCGDVGPERTRGSAVQGLTRRI